MSQSKALFWFCLILSVLLLITCTERRELPTSPSGNPPLAAVDTILVAPSSGIPGSIIEIAGFLVDTASISVTVYVGDQPTVFHSDSSGITAIIPLFIDSASGWSQPPSGLQDVSIRVDSQLVAIAKDALLIDSLPHADNATETIIQDLQIMSSSMRSIWNAVGSSPESDPRLSGYRTAILTMMDSILTGADSSIAALINGTSTWNDGQQVDMALIDAVLASSGALEFYNEISASLGQLDKALQTASVEGLLCKDGGPDIDLACEMQVYVVLDNYANYFVKPTTTTYANTVGLAAGVLAVSGIGLAGEAIIGALLTVFDFVYGTLAPSLFPAEITQFSLEVATDTVAVDERTNTTIQISAVNKPATIHASDVLEYLLTSLGLAKASQAAESFRAILKDAMKFALNLYRKAIVKHNTATGGSVFIDPEADLPPLHWGPVTITNADLVELYSFTEDIITADTTAFEWQGVSRGEGRIQARARGAGERSKVLKDNALCWGCVYSGGAFGENAPGTETKTVIVGKPARLTVEITGLPEGTEASVMVSGPEYFSPRITATDTLTDLGPGDYTVTAIEVRDGNDDKYLPSPIDTTVTLAEGDHQTVAIEYEPEYGNILITVAGLPEGVDADISVTGEGSSYQIYSDTLLDSLTAGAYTIAAHDVLDLDGETQIIASPQSQDVDITPGETAIASVVYSPETTMKIYIGAYDHQLEYFAEGYLPVATAACGSSSDGQTCQGDSLFLPDLSYGPDCKMVGGVEMTSGQTHQFTASCGSGTASGSATFNVSYNDANTITVDATVSTSATAPGPTDTTPFEQYSASSRVGASCPLLIEIANPDARNLAFVVTYTASGGRSGDLGAKFGAGFNSNLNGLWDNCTPVIHTHFYANPSFGAELSISESGIDTVSIENLTLSHLRLWVSSGSESSGTTYTDQNGDISEQRSGQATATISIIARLIELP